jgi:dihydrofolate reductase
MKKLIWSNMMTLDGFFEGPNRDIRWHNVDSEFVEFAIEQLGTVDTILFGRVTYAMMAEFWPSEYAKVSDPVTAEKMNSLPKLVFSKTLDKAEWNNTTLLKDITYEKITRLKQDPGKDLILFGSANLATTLINLNLIDEYRIMINPVILGAGTPLFMNVHKSINLKLVNSRVFRSGNVLLCYQEKVG